MTRGSVMLCVAGLALGACDTVFQLQGPPDAPPPSDLLIHYQMDELVEDQVLDVSGHGHHARCTSCPVPVAGQVGRALVFDGSSQLLRLPSTVELNATTAVTVTAWIRIDRYLGTAGCIAGKRYGAVQRNSWQLCVTAAVLRMWNHEVRLDDPGPMLPNSEWHHVAARWDGTLATLFVDGQFRAEQAMELVFDDGELVFGGDVDSMIEMNWFPGAIDDLRVYNRALSTSEVAELAVASP